MSLSVRRRAFLQKVTALSAAGVALPAAGSMRRVKYDPATKVGVNVGEVEFRRNAKGRMLMARVYQPEGKGPFPVLLDLHGGGWNYKDRYANEPMDRAIASSGVLVVAIDMTLAGEAPYPASVQDAHYGVRWLKWRAAQWHGDASSVGIFGSSTGGHIGQLIAMRPRDPRYAAHALAEAPHLDAGVGYFASRSPISDPYARYLQAEKMKRERMINFTKTWFVPWETIFEANPQHILDRRESVVLRPFLIMQGALDDNVLPAVQEKFAASYRAAGGECQLEIFEGSDHEWVAKPGPQTDRAYAVVKTFIARHVNGG